MFEYVTIAFMGSAIKCIFNPLYTEWTPQTIYWKSLISILGMSSYVI